MLVTEHKPLLAEIEYNLSFSVFAFSRESGKQVSRFTRLYRDRQAVDYCVYLLINILLLFFIIIPDTFNVTKQIIHSIEKAITQKADFWNSTKFLQNTSNTLSCFYGLK
jgi:hypothetical protein